ERQDLLRRLELELAVADEVAILHHDRRPDVVVVDGLRLADLPQDAGFFQAVDPFGGPRRVDEDARHPQDRRIDDPFALESDERAPGNFAPKDGDAVVITYFLP